METTTRILFCVLAFLLIAAENNLAAENPDDSIISRTADGQVILRSRRPSGAVADFLPYAPDELLVRFKDNVAPAAKSAVHGRYRSTPIKRFRHTRNLELVKLPHDASLNQALKSYRDQHDVLYAEPNYLVEHTSVIISNPGTPPPVVTPNDPSFPAQWNLHNTGQNGGTPGADIKAAEAWSITTGSKDVVVAVIDTGIDYTHQDLAANMWRNEADCNNNGIDDDGNGYIDDCYGIDTFNDDSDPMDDNDHGTHVAGIVGAVGNNGLGVVGVNWNVKIMACKFMGSDGFGTVADAIDCLEYVQTMKDRGVNIVATNNSWGAYGYSEALRDAIAAQLSRGILFIAAAGNGNWNNDTTPSYPASYYLPNIISVATTHNLDGLAQFSNYGTTTVHIGAPGVNILSTTIGNTYSVFSGTSMATPHVAGVAALLKAQDTTRDWKAIKNLILSSGTTLSSLGSILTQSRLNAFASLTCANAISLARLLPREKNIVGGIAPIDLSVAHIKCGDPNGQVNVMINPGGLTVILRDDGLGADQVAGDGIYSARWTPPSGGTFTVSFPNGDVLTVQIDPDLKPGFPVKTFHGPGTYYGAQNIHTLVGNMDDDPNLEIVVTALASGPLYAWKSDGTPVNGWPLSDYFGPGYPAMGDLSSEVSGQEIFSTYLGSPGKLSAYSGNGSTLSGWPRNSANSATTPATLADVDHDGIDEIFIGEEDWRLHAYKANGSVLAGWPPPFVPIGGQRRNTPAVADLNGDGNLEIVTISGTDLFAYDRDGRTITGFPVSGQSVGSPGFGPFLAIGDVDGDGVPEIVVPSIVGGGLDSVPAVTVFSATGSVKHTMVAAGGVTATAPGLADLDGDGIPEIIMQTDGALNVWKGNGSIFPGWPVIGPGWPQFGLRDVYNSSPVVGDIDGDQLPDIVITSAGAVWAYNRNGVLLPQFPKIIDIGMGAVPAIADIDRDGRNELIVTGDFWNGFPGDYNKVWVYDLGGPTHGAVMWGQFMGGPKHQGYYQGGFKVPQKAMLSVVLKGANPGIVSGLGINCGSDCSEAYAPGTIVTLTVNPTNGSPFSGWRGGTCSGTGPCTLKIDHDTVVTAVFGRTLTLNVVKTGSGTVESRGSAAILCGDDCSEEYYSPTVVTLTAVPAAGLKFLGWMGGASSCYGTGWCSVYLDRDMSITAVFGTSSGLNLIVTKSGTGGGVISSNVPGIYCGTDCEEKYALGATVTLSAIADAGSSFSGWTGACSGTGNCTVSMDGDKTVTAIFTLPLIINSAGLSNGEVGVSYSSALAPGGGLPPYTFTVLKGSLPPGISLGSPVILGTPSRAGKYSFTAQVTDQLGGSVTQKLQIKVIKAVGISTKSLKNGRLNRAYNARLAATGGQAPYSWSLVSGTFPDGLTFDPSSGSITGTPTAAGNADLTFQVGDALGGISQRSLALSVK